IDVIGSVIVEIELTNGINGVGISIGGEPACYIIEHHFSRFLKGEDQHNIEYLWDLMWCSLINYGRKGLTIQAISADCYMSLTVGYTLKLLELIKPYNIKWLEEPLPPDQYNGYAQIKKENHSTCLLTCGEHEYTR
ncbi:unnamed protein product, partial [Rotaria sp. Silwood2]